MPLESKKGGKHANMTLSKDELDQLVSLLRKKGVK
jgi:hypothetical protein